MLDFTILGCMQLWSRGAICLYITSHHDEAVWFKSRIVNKDRQLSTSQAGRSALITFNQIEIPCSNIGLFQSGKSNRTTTQNRQRASNAVSALP